MSLMFAGPLARLDVPDEFVHLKAVRASEVDILDESDESSRGLTSGSSFRSREKTFVEGEDLPGGMDTEDCSIFVDEASVKKISREAEAIVKFAAMRFGRKKNNIKDIEPLKLPRFKGNKFTALLSEVQKQQKQKRGSFALPPLQRFKRAARLVHIILTAIRTTRRENAQQESKLMSFAQLQDDISSNRTTYGDGLDFDPVFYKAQKEHHIAPEAKVILEMTPKTRSDEQIHMAIVALNQAVEAFGEFPVKMQQSLVQRGWYERFEAKRVIIRQGHYADNFYFILSGTAVVTILMTDKKTGEPFMNTVAFLKKGNSFGELALMYGGTRNATVTCKDDVELLAVGRDDFVDIFMHVDIDKEPEHISFLRSVDLLNGWPIAKLPYEDPKTCLFTYFRRGVIMCRDSKNMEWIYIIKTGSCRVLKALQPTKAELSAIQTSPDLRLSTGAVQIPKPKKKRRKVLPIDPNLTNAGLLRLTGQLQKNEKPRNLPPLMRQSTIEVNKSIEEHQQTIEKLYNEHNEKSERDKRRVRIQEEKKPPPLKPPSGKVYVQVQKLGPKETFGLVQVAFHVMHDTTSMVLVSDGAECVLINKNFFLKHLSEGEHKRLRQTIQPYPTEDELQRKLQDQMNWDAYKVLAIEKELQESKKLSETINH